MSSDDLPMVHLQTDGWKMHDSSEFPQYATFIAIIIACHEVVFYSSGSQAFSWVLAHAYRVLDEQPLRQKGGTL